MNKELNDLRESLDTIDDALAERFRIPQKIWKYKSDHRLPAGDKARKKVQFARLERPARDRGLDPECAARMLLFIIDEVGENHKAMRGAKG